MLAQSILEYGGLARAFDEIGSLGTNAQTWVMSRTTREMVFVGVLVLVVLYIVRLFWRRPI